MSLNKTAQMIADFIVEEPIVINPDDSGEHIVVYTEQPEPEIVMEMHDPEALEDLDFPTEVEEAPAEITIEIGELPGVEGLDPELEEKLEVVEEPEELKADDDKKSKVPAKWDWQSKGSHGFVAWIKERLDDVPKHSGYDSAGIERAISYMEKLDTEISKAMRLDLDGELDSNKIEEVRSAIDDGVERLRERLSKINRKGKKKKKADFESSDEIVKEAQKASKISGTVVTVPLLISGIVRTCINGAISSGHDLENAFSELAKKYKLTDREKFECYQLMDDMGYAGIRRDRGFLGDEDVNPTSSDNFDWNGNFHN